MEGNYVETTVVRERRYVDILVRALWLGALVWGTFLLFPINGMLVFMYIGLHGTLMYFFWNNYKLEYEYVFCDGQIDFDIIRNSQKRKHKLRIQLEDGIYFAKPDNPKIVNNKDVHTVVEYISSKNAGNIYALIVKKQDKILKILFQPNQRMIKSIKNKMANRCDIRQADLLDE